MFLKLLESVMTGTGDDRLYFGNPKLGISRYVESRCSEHVLLCGMPLWKIPIRGSFFLSMHDECCRRFTVLSVYKMFVKQFTRKKYCRVTDGAVIFSMTPMNRASANTPTGECSMCLCFILYKQYIIIIIIRHHDIIKGFYQRVSIASYASAGIARAEMSVCPSVCPTHSGIVSKRRKLAS